MAMAGYHVSSLKPNKVPASLQKGTFALKWPEDTNKSNPIAYHLSIDPKGFYFMCLNKITKELECLDIALIHDTRTDTDVSLPRSLGECEQMNIGTAEIPLTSKWLTIYYGNSFIPDREFRIIHFSFQAPDHAREWADQLFRLGHNPLLRNLCSLGCLEKVHSRIIYGLAEDRFDKKVVPVRSLIQFLCRNRSDSSKEGKILQTLKFLELADQPDSMIDRDSFTFNKFVRLYMHLMERHEIDKLFDATYEATINDSVLALLPGGKHRRYLSWDKMRGFIFKQNDAEGGAFGKDYYDQKAKDLVKKYTQHDPQFKEKGMSDESFLQYLLSFDNFIFDPAQLDLCMDMDKPLSHYFIASSHNTYLTGSQLTGRASVEMYRQALLTGCRCVELDIVDAEKGEEPEIKHKNTPVRPVSFLQVIAAIRDSAFKVSPYPVILSFENHCSPLVQTRMAQYLVDIFRDSLITEPLKTHPTEPNTPLPSPNDLKYKIIIKNKKIHRSENEPSADVTTQNLIRKVDSRITLINDLVETTGSSLSSPAQSCTPNLSNDANNRQDALLNETRSSATMIDSNPTTTLHNSSTGEGVLVHDGDNSSGDSDDDDILTPAENSPDKNAAVANINPAETLTTNQLATATKESKVTQALSDLIHYAVAVQFVSFAQAEERNRSYEVSSFSEDKAQSLVRDYAKEFVEYNQRQLSRVYPRGTRFDSSNYNPYLFWPVGCQMVALNYQTLDTPMQVNLGLFAFNGGCGYLKKPASLCQSTGSFDPNRRTNVENVVGYQIDIKILSGQFLCQDREPAYVDVEMYGVYADATKRNEYRLRAKRWNGFQAVYEDNDVETGEFSIRFSKVILPEMAALRFAVSEEDGTFIGQSIIPVAHLRPGYRHITLKNQINIPVQSASLFIYTRKTVHVDDENKELINQLVSPTTVSSTSKEQRPKPVKSNELLRQRSQSYGDFNSLGDSSTTETKSDISTVSFSSHRSLEHNYSSTDDICNMSNESSKINRKRNQSTPTIAVNRNQIQLIATSQLNDDGQWCKELVLEDVHRMKTFQRKRENIEARGRRISLEYEKKIEYEEERFRKCLYPQKYRLGTLLSKFVSDPAALDQTSMSVAQLGTLLSSRIDNSSISEDVERAEARLLDLYSNKFHAKNEIEYKLSKDYYNDLEKYVYDYYHKQLTTLENITKQEQAKVKEDVRLRMKHEMKQTLLKEKDKQKAASLKDKIRQNNIEAGALAIRKLQEMHERSANKIQLNLQKTLYRLREERDLETKRRFGTYSDELNSIKLRLQREICNARDGCINYKSPSKSQHQTIPTSTSLSSISDRHHYQQDEATGYSHSSANDRMISSQPYRRQTINGASITTNSHTHQQEEEETHDLDQTTESTQL